MGSKDQGLIQLGLYAFTRTFLKKTLLLCELVGSGAYMKGLSKSVQQASVSKFLVIFALIDSTPAKEYLITGS
jgi:hypothetical protein